MISIRYNTKEYVLGISNTNTYVVHNDCTEDVMIIGLGGLEDNLEDSLASWTKLRELNIIAVVATHDHFDHIYGVCKFYQT